MKLFGRRLQKFLTANIIVLVTACSSNQVSDNPIDSKKVKQPTEEMMAGLGLLTYMSKTNLKVKTYDQQQLSEGNRFTFLSPECLDAESQASQKIDRAIWKQHAFQLRNSLELRGYHFTELSKNSDMYISLESLLSRNKSISSSTNSFQKQLDCSLENRVQYGEHFSVNRQVINLFDSSHLGLTSLTARLVGYRNNQIVLDVLATAESGNKNNLVNYQTIYRKLSKVLPVLNQQPTSRNSFGFSFAIINKTGDRYFPVITRVVGESVADISGLRATDTLVSISGVSTQNKTFLEIAKLFHHQQVLSVGIIRDSEYQNISMRVDSL